MPESNMERHAAAMLHPQGENEFFIVGLFVLLTQLADTESWAHEQKVEAVEHLARTIVALLDGDTGRLDPAALAKQVRDTAVRAGVDPRGN
jgi:glycine/D-amino acid oxidase-like deaminating enzyme